MNGWKIIKCYLWTQPFAQTHTHMHSHTPTSRQMQLQSQHQQHQQQQQQQHACIHDDEYIIHTTLRHIDLKCSLQMIRVCAIRIELQNQKRKLSKINQLQFDLVLCFARVRWPRTDRSFFASSCLPMHLTRIHSFSDRYCNKFSHLMHIAQFVGREMVVHGLMASDWVACSTVIGLRGISSHWTAVTVPNDWEQPSWPSAATC